MSTYKYAIDVDCGTYGLLQEVGIVNKVKVNEAYGADGEVADYTDSDYRKEVDCEFIFDSAQLEPSPGDDIVCDSLKYHIDEVVIRRSNQGYEKLTFKGTRWIINSLPA